MPEVNMDLYYAPMSFYIILAIGVAFYSILSSRHPRTGPSLRANALLLFSWTPLLLYNVAVLVRVMLGSREDPYQEVPNRRTQGLMMTAYVLHWFATFTFFLWLFFRKRAQE